MSTEKETKKSIKYIRVYIEGPGVASIKSKELAETEEFKRQLEAVKKFKALKLKK